MQTSFYHGIVGHGLLGAINEFLLLSRRALNQRTEAMALSGAPGGPRCVTSVDGEELDTIQRFTEDYIAEGMSEANLIRLSESLSTINQFQTNNIVVTALSVLTLLRE